jgi:hypothetical protein
VDGGIEYARSTVEAALRGSRYGVVATAASDRPHAAWMAFAPVAQGRELVLASRRGTRKYRDLTSNPHVSVVIDHEQRQWLRAARRVGVTAVGSAEVVAGAEVVGARSAFVARNPDLAGFVAESDCTLLRIRVDGYRVAEGIDAVTWCPAPVLVGDPVAEP